MNQPPKILHWFLDRCCSESRPDLKGDFLELYDHRCQALGRPTANRKLLRDTLSIIPLKFIIKEKRTAHQTFEEL
jgi:hypothetical protein